MRSRFLLAPALTLGVLLVVSSSVKADQYSYTYDTTNSPQVNVTFDPGNSRSSASTYAGAFTVTDTSGGSLPLNTVLTAFCIDLWHTSSSPFTAGVNNLASSNQLTGLLASGYTPTADLASQLSYLATVYNTVKGLTGTSYYNAIGAVQLAVWALIDQKPPGAAGFATNQGNSGLNADYKSIVQALGGSLSSGPSYSASNIDGTHSGTGTNTVEGLTLTNYNAGLIYSGGATLLQITGQGPSSSQNLVVFNGSLVTTSITPEPSTMAIAGLGALGMIGYGWKRRKRA